MNVISWVLKKHLTTLWDIGNCTLKNLLNTKMTMYFSKFYGKVGVISWFLFHLIWKNYVLILTWKVELWIFSLVSQRFHNFSSQNFSIENNYCFSAEFVIRGILQLVILFCQTEIVLKDSAAFVYVTKSEKSSH